MGRLLSPLEANNLKERLLAKLNLRYSKIGNSLYEIDGERVNVKVSSKRVSGHYWFNIQRKNVDSYIWMCYDPEIEDWETYYWITRREMWDLIRHGSYRDRTWERSGRPIPNFVIDPRKDLYAGGGKEKIPIGKFRNLRKPSLK
jgi:hypothetical protein